MRMAPLYQQQLDTISQKNRQEGRQEGLQEGVRTMVENLLKSRFGPIDDRLSTIIDPILALPTEEITTLLISSSKEELLARFSSSPD